MSKYTESLYKQDYSDWISDQKLPSHDGYYLTGEDLEFVYDAQQSKINELLEENKKLRDLFDDKPTHWSNVIYDKNKELDQLEKRLEKYEEKAQRDDKKICDMGFKLHEVNERLRECEEKLKALNFYCSEYGLKEESFAILMACEKACEYFKKYEGKDD